MHHPVHEVHVVLVRDRSVASTAMMALRAGGLRIAMWMALKPLQEMPNIPTLPFENGCFDSQSITWSPSRCRSRWAVGNERAFAVAGAADVDARHDVAAADEVGIEVVAAAASVVLAIGADTRAAPERVGHRRRPWGATVFTASRTPSLIGICTSSSTTSKVGGESGSADGAGTAPPAARAAAPTDIKEEANRQPSHAWAVSHERPPSVSAGQRCRMSRWG